MQLTNLLASVAFASVAAAECYQSGADWDDKDQAAKIAKTACEAQLATTYGPESTYNGQKGACMNTVGGKIDFVIRHITDGDRVLGVDECYDGLQSEIYNCGKGGDSHYTNWFYKYELPPSQHSFPP